MRHARSLFLLLILACSGWLWAQGENSVEGAPDILPNPYPDSFSDRPEIYPADAFTQCIEGWLELELVVDNDGNVLEVKVIASEPGEVFDAHVGKVAKTWQMPTGMVLEGDESARVRTKIQLFMEDYSHCV